MNDELHYRMLPKEMAEFWHCLYCHRDVLVSEVPGHYCASMRDFSEQAQVITAKGIMFGRALGEAMQR